MLNLPRRCGALALVIIVSLTALLLISCGRGGSAAEDTVPRVTVDELKQRMDAGEPIVVGDTRSPEAFATSHIAGAVSIPLDSAESAVAGIPLDQEIILYCT